MTGNDVTIYILAYARNFYIDIQLILVHLT